MKPFVEKPVDGDDHNVMIYYPSSAGGGRKDLFRKVGNRSSEFHPELRRVRPEGSYIYEEFMPTGDTDVKVLADGVIPNEYGINPKHKLIIGAKIAHWLMGKILIDLRNTKEETLSVAELKKDDEENDDAAAAMLHSPKKLDGSKDSPRVGSRRQQSAAENESHIHSLTNILWYCHLDDSLKGEPGLVSNEGLQRISKIKELDYLTHIVLRMFENTAATPRNRDHTLPVLLAVTLQEDGRYVTLDQLEKLV
ncbi:unnamed protein product [Sphagnum compactum]